MSSTFNVLKQIKEVTEDQALSPTQKLILIQMALGTDNSTGLVRSSMAEIAKKAGVGRMTVHRLIHGGEAQRYFIISKIHPRRIDLVWSNMYHGDTSLGGSDDHEGQKPETDIVDNMYHSDTCSEGDPNTQHVPPRYMTCTTMVHNMYHSDTPSTITTLLTRDNDATPDSDESVVATSPTPSAGVGGEEDIQDTKEELETFPLVADEEPPSAAHLEIQEKVPFVVGDIDLAIHMLEFNDKAWALFVDPDYMTGMVHRDAEKRANAALTHCIRGVPHYAYSKKNMKEVSSHG